MSGRAARVAAAPLLAAASLAALACGSGDAPSPPAPPTRAAPSAASEAPLALPPPGETRIARRGDRYDVAASEAAPLDALTELSLQGGFRVERAAARPAAAPRTLWLRDVSLERAVAAILAGVPHVVHHEPADGDLDPSRPLAGRAVVLARVTVGDSRARGAEAEASALAKESRAFERRADARHARRERAQEADVERAESIARGAEDPDPRVRLEAVERMEPDEGDRARLERLLREDPSPDVRAGAAERLSEGDPFAATPGLLEALADPDPAVTAAAVEALADVYDEAPDPRIREAVASLREHRDADVREAVSEFEEWIGE